MFPKIPLLPSPTPLVELRNLPQYLGCRARFFLKCDDMAPLGGAGNKLRKLEYLAAEAIEQGADTLLTTGCLQSNHARLTAAVAARVGMACELVLNKQASHSSESCANNGNVLLMRSFGAKLHVLEPDQDAKAYVCNLMQNLRAAGRKPFLIPFGGSCVQGALGYVNCAREIESQLAAQDLQADYVFCATGSGGTQAGLVAGFAASDAPTRVRGVSVLHPQKRIAPIVGSLANGALLLMKRKPLPYGSRAVRVDDSQIGEGYGQPSPCGLDAISLIGRTEGVILDPVYTGKAFAGLLAAARNERWCKHVTVVFVHSGGAPGLYAHADALTEHLRQQPALVRQTTQPAAAQAAVLTHMAQKREEEHGHEADGCSVTILQEDTQIGVDIPISDVRA